ncbi:MAG: DNA polymerase Y family protein [Erythrobacter sp.]
MAIWAAQLSVDRWRLSKGLKRGEGVDAAPLALISETAHGPRLEAVNDAGRQAGLHSAMMLADARTLCPDLNVEPADPAGDLEALEKLTLWAQRWGPWSALDPSDGVIVDVTGTAHLFGGEDRLLNDVEQRFSARDIAVRTAIAPTAGAAWALAHYGANAAILSPAHDMAAQMASLPVAALRLDADVLTVLRRLGLKRLGDLTAVEQGRTRDRANIAPNGRDALQRRFRRKFTNGMKGRKSPAFNPLVRMDQLLGRVPEPLLPIVPHHMPLVQRRLAEPLRHRDLLDQVLHDLTHDMVRMLEGRGEGARRLDLGLWRVDGEVIIRSLEMAEANRDPAHIIRLFTGKLEDIDAGFGIESVRLRASWSEPLILEQNDIETASSKESEALGTSLAACIDRISVKLGQGSVTQPVPQASHLPERAHRWEPYGVQSMVTQTTYQEVLKPYKRPLKILDYQEKIHSLDESDGLLKRFQWRGRVHDVMRAEGPERIAPEWWRMRSTARLRDYYRIEDAEGRRYWIYREGELGDGRGGSPDWFIHGVFG